MEVCVIKPASMEDTREIADTLLAGCTVVLNLEGIDVDIAQRDVYKRQDQTCFQDFSHTAGKLFAVQGF